MIYASPISISFPFCFICFFFFLYFVYLDYMLVLQRVAQEAVDQVMTGELPLMQLAMALLAVVVRDLDQMVIVDIIVIPHKMVIWTLAPTLAAVVLLTDYHLLHQVLRVTNINKWPTFHVLLHFWSLRLLLPHFIPLRIRSRRNSLFLPGYLGDEKGLCI